MPADAFFTINGQPFIKNSINLRLCDINSIGVNINFNTKAYKDLRGGGGLHLSGLIGRPSSVNRPYKIRKAICVLCLGDTITKSSIYTNTSKPFCFIINLTASATK